MTAIQQTSQNYNAKSINELKNLLNDSALSDEVKQKIDKMIDLIMRILKGGISSSEIGQILDLLNQFGGSIPEELMAEITEGLQNAVKKGADISPTIEKILEALFEVLANNMMNKLPISST